MSETTFRTAVEPTESTPVKVDTSNSVISTESKNDLVATYADEHGKPYVAKSLEVENIWDKEPTMKRELETLEGYIVEQVKQGKLENSTRATDKFIKELYKKADVNPHEGYQKKIDKLLAYIDFRRVIDA